MNQGKIWLVVKPTVGLPAFLGGVAVISLCVHSAVLNNTTWYPGFYSGKAGAAPAKAAMATPAPATTATATPAGSDAPVLVAKAAVAKP